MQIDKQVACILIVHTRDPGDKLGRGGLVEGHAGLVGDGVGERGLPAAGRPVQEDRSRCSDLIRTELVLLMRK